MPRKVSAEPIRRLTVELPESEYNALEAYCLERQETKRQVIRTFIRRLQQKGEGRSQQSTVRAGIIDP